MTESKLLIQLQLNLIICEFCLCRFACSWKRIKSPCQIPVVHVWLYVDRHTDVKSLLHSACMSHVTQGSTLPSHFDVHSVNCDLFHTPFSATSFTLWGGWGNLLLVSFLFKMLPSIVLEGYTEFLSVTKLS